MRRISYSNLGFAVLCMGLLASSAAFAAGGLTCPGNTPNPNGANVALRVFNDCPTALVSATNGYPGSIVISNMADDCFGGANLHNWSFSTDGGATKAQFENCSYYHFCATVCLDGNANAEAGLRLGPWWSPDADGKFMINAATGEIACFSGRLPFYSFSNPPFSIRYQRGSCVRMDITYNPHSLLASDPATITYAITIGPNTYTSPALPFDQGNPAEGHGEWGALFPAYAGGYFQIPGGNGLLLDMVCTWSNICYENLGATATSRSSWGKIKTLYR